MEDSDKRTNPFDRKITSRVLADDGTEDVTFECGHEITFVIPSVQEVYTCAQCIQDYVAGHGASITCPKCGKTSYHPKDIAERYCGFCHEFHETMQAT